MSRDSPHGGRICGSGRRFSLKAGLRTGAGKESQPEGWTTNGGCWECAVRLAGAAEEGELVVGEGLGFAGARLSELGLAGFAEFLVLEVGED